MNVKRTCLEALVAARLKVEGRYTEWDVLSVSDIRQYFHLAMTPVFVVNGVRYSVKTRIGRPGLYEHELVSERCRQWLRDEMIYYIKRDEQIHQQMRGFPDFQYWVYSVKLNSAPLVHPDGRRFYKVFWRYAVVKSANWQQ